jgi:DNA-directed RNA polymerase specialized sigma24 family protein
MTARQAVEQYYDAWRSRRGDMSGVPLADDFRFVGPVTSFDTAEGYREMARQAGQAVTSFEVRRQFADGNTVCSIVDWEMAMALQRLPPRQRGVLVLRDVLGFRAAEVAEMLDTTEVAVTRLLHRARGVMDRDAAPGTLADAPLPESPAERALVARFATAFQSGDIPA